MPEAKPEASGLKGDRLLASLSAFQQAALLFTMKRQFCSTLLFSLTMSLSANSKEILSHPPLHTPVFSKESEFPKGPVYYVDARAGDDSAAGTKDHPWKSIRHAMPRLSPGDTLLLRGGTYYENVTCAVVGEPDRPITIRSFPGEEAVLDGGMPEFQTDPASAWQPGSAPGEYVSTGTYRNIRDVLGLFGDSQVGLQTYWHHDNLVSENETTAIANGVPFYCGPGLYYNKLTGKVHARLAHTFQTRPGFVNYRGETDPRKLPLIVAPFRSTPLFLDQAMHVRFKDLVIRGGGFNTVLMNFAVDVQFDYVTIIGGSYCIRAKNSGPVRMTNCGIIGQIPPWGYWSDNALQTYDPVYYDPFTQPPEPRANRNVARLPTHALLVTEGAEESDIFANPFNNHWTITQCEFADGHDGIYLNGRKMDLNHCLVTRIQDDGFYLVSPTPQGVNDDVHIYRNYVAGCMNPFGGHLRSVSSGTISIYGNIVDGRYLTQMYRPSSKWPEGRFTSSAVFVLHGRGKPAGMENIGFYYNTFLFAGVQFAGATYAKPAPESTREIFNNIFVYFNELPTNFPTAPLDGRVDMDGNLHWAPRHDPEQPEAWMDKIRNSEAATANVEKWGGLPWEKHSRYDNPRFRDWSPDRLTGNDYRLDQEGIAAKMAVDFPFRAKLKDAGVAGPAVGALQAGDVFRVGIDRRITAGNTQPR